MVSFAGWNFLGVTAGTLNTQGVNILMNVYFGVAVNAARGIAVQASAAISQFVQSFTTAVNPQITKSYAAGDMTYMHTLVCQSSKFSAYLFLLMAIPLSVETSEIFEIWLKNPPEYAVLFFRLSLLGTLMDSVLSNSLMTAIFATGDIKKYQVYVTICGGMVFPLTWLAYLMGASPDSTYIIYFIIYCVVLYVRLHVIQQKVHLQIKEYARRVLVKFIPVAVLSYLVPISIAYLMPASFGRILITTIVSVVITCAIIYSIGLTIGERNMVMSKAKKITNKYLSK
jgi:O-antigen/teichoic acid export membrane protein